MEGEIEKIKKQSQNPKPHVRNQLIRLSEENTLILNSIFNITEPIFSLLLKYQFVRMAEF